MVQAKKCLLFKETITKVIRNPQKPCFHNQKQKDFEARQFIDRFDVIVHLNDQFVATAGHLACGGRSEPVL